MKKDETPSRQSPVMSPKKVGLIVFEGVAAADLTGPAEAFSRANISGGNGCESSCYNVLMLGITAQPCRTECEIVVKPHTDLASAPATRYGDYPREVPGCAMRLLGNCHCLYLIVSNQSSSISKDWCRA